MKAKYLRALLAALLLLPAAALADTISPSSYSTTLAVGGTSTVTKTVTINAGSPTTAQLDVLFLFDTTGSMSGLLSSAKNSAGAVLTGLSSFGNVQFGVAEYKDYPISPYGDPGDFPYKLNQAITSSTPAVTTALNGLSASGGFDGPESQLKALSDAAGAATGWRAGSTKVAVWFGDAPGHDSASEAGYPGPTLTATIATLTGNKIVVEAIDLSAMNSTGQVTAITSATGGSSFTGAVSDATIVDTIKSLVEDVFATYANVSLDTSEVPGGVGVSVTPLNSNTGSFDRETDRTFGFDVTFTGLATGDYSFNIYALVDGGRVATESDRIKVGDGTAVPEPATLLLIGFGLLGLTGVQRRMKK